MLRLFGRVNIRGFIASVPILLTVHYTLYTMNIVLHACILVSILLLLGLYFNRYTFIISLAILSYLTLMSPSLGVYGLTMWLIGLICAKPTSFVDVVIAFTVMVGSLSLVIDLGLTVIILLTPLAVYVLGLTGVDLIHSPRFLGLSLLLITIAVVVAKVTDSDTVLNVYALSTITSILLLERIIKASTMEEVS